MLGLSIFLFFSCQKSPNETVIVFYKLYHDNSIVRIDTMNNDVFLSSFNIIKLDNEVFSKWSKFDGNQNITHVSEYFDNILSTSSDNFYQNDKLILLKSFKFNDGLKTDSLFLTYKYLYNSKGLTTTKIIDSIANRELCLIEDYVDSSLHFATSKTFKTDTAGIIISEYTFSFFDENWNLIKSNKHDLEDNSISFVQNSYDSLNRIIFNLELLNGKLKHSKFYYYENEHLKEISTYNKNLINTRLIVDIK
jgi:hypothetical protein